MYFFFSSRRRHTRSCLVSWARRCVQETGTGQSEFENLSKAVDNGVVCRSGGILKDVSSGRFAAPITRISTSTRTAMHRLLPALLLLPASAFAADALPLSLIHI
eukprot:TRINITY_DN4439_c0_g1_i1.p3 TRINITY_DN4439_c0_g1~~TRINITY_DN4439_c0_g1_i1.p3  ORF type:complete len:104 (-),score=1.00 TRINITY_DN4439_c0_g1_i1:137-448(-)